MPPSEQPRVFISYARKDGAALAQRLQNDLTKQGFDAWLDTQRIAGGAVWSTEIEHAIDDAEFVLALMTSGLLRLRNLPCRTAARPATRANASFPCWPQAAPTCRCTSKPGNYRDFTD